MTNAITGNPMVIDEAASIWTATRFVRLIQWVDDAGDVVDTSTWILTVNGVTLTVNYQMTANVSPIVIWQIGPFNPALRINSFVVATVGEGAFHVWLDQQ